MSNRQSITDKLAAIFTNGTGEAGLEVGTDPGLPRDQYIQIPKCMHKRVFFEIGDADFVRYEKEVNKSDSPDLLNRPSMDDFPTADDCSGEPGIHECELALFHADKMQVTVSVDGTDRSYKCTDVRFEPFTFDDIAAFYIANKDHIGADRWTDRTPLWIHAIRFWAVVAGFVTTNHNKEWVVVETPPIPPSDSALDEAVEFILDYKSNAWTAAAARTTSWRKSNHATGGDKLAGFPRRWAAKMGYVSTSTDKIAAAREDRLLTSAFYTATHAICVHAVLALMIPDDPDHFAYIDPSYGIITDWEVGASTKIRIAPKTQVAGTAIVVDCVKALEIATREGLSPFIASIGQFAPLLAAYTEVRQQGMRCATYARWFFEDHPTSSSVVTFDQKDTSFALLAGELAVIATRYYAGSTLAGSASLQNAVQQLADESAKTTWAQLAAHRTSASAEQLMTAIARVRGASAGSAVAQLASADATVVSEGVAAFNTKLDDIAAAIGIATDSPAPTPLHANLDRVLASLAPSAAGA